MTNIADLAAKLAIYWGNIPGVTVGFVLTADGVGRPLDFQAAPAGGIAAVVDDPTPQLGGDLDMNGSDIISADAGGPEISDSAASATNATLRPSRAVPTSGIGISGSSVDIIVAGLSRLRIGTGIGNPNTVFQPLGVSGLFIGSVSGSFGLHNVASSATVPSLLNNSNSETAGIGGALNAVAMIGGSLSRVTADGTGLGFFATTPVARPTGVAVTAAGIHAALVTLGLITA